MHDTGLHRRRHRIGNGFARLKDRRRVATRHDRCPKVFLSVCALELLFGTFGPSNAQEDVTASRTRHDSTRDNYAALPPLAPGSKCFETSMEL